MNEKKSKIKSSCCKAKVRLIGKNNPITNNGKVTCYLICTKCNKPCDIYTPIRKIWKINPVTKIKGDERNKQRKKQAEKEIRENEHN